jgi:hypothetical protein
MPSRLTVVFVSLLLATSAVIFWLWFVIVSAKVAILCPQECWCDKGGYCAQCYGPTLTRVSPLLLPNARQLGLFNHQVTLLETDSFFLLTGLEIFYLCGGELRTILLGAFDGLTKLKQLSMSSNKISEVIPGTF